MRRAAALALVLAGCRVELDFDGTHYLCADGVSCPPGTLCVAGMCVEPAADGAPPPSDGQADAHPVDATPPSDGASADQASAGYRDVVLADRPILYLRLDDAGDTAVDHSGNGRNGTYLGGVARVASGALAEANGAASFDGVDDLIEVPDDAALRLNDSFTIEVWVRVEALVHTYPGIINKGEEESPLTGYLIYYPTDFPELVFKRAGIDTRRTEDGLVTVGGWRHYALTYDATATTLRWYVDGAMNREYTGLVYLVNVETDPVEIGRGDEAGQQILDELALYDQALPAERVQAHFAAAGP